MLTDKLHTLNGMQMSHRIEIVVVNLKRRETEFKDQKRTNRQQRDFDSNSFDLVTGRRHSSPVISPTSSDPNPCNPFNPSHTFCNTTN